MALGYVQTKEPHTPSVLSEVPRLISSQTCLAPCLCRTRAELILPFLLMPVRGLRQVKRLAQNSIFFLGFEERSQMAKCLLYKHEDWRSARRSPHEELGAGMHTCKPRPGRQKQATPQAFRRMFSERLCLQIRGVEQVKKTWHQPVVSTVLTHTCA